MACYGRPTPMYKSSRKSRAKKRPTLVKAQVGKWYTRKHLVRYKSAFRLLDLPCTVTAQIWRECLTAEKPIKVCVPPFPELTVFFRNKYTEPPHISMLCDPIGVDVSVLIVCCRVFDEAKWAIYQANTFDYGFVHYEANTYRWSQKFHEQIPEPTDREEAGKWRRNGYFSLASDDGQQSLQSNNLFVALPADKVTAIRSLSVSSPTPRFDLCASFQKLRHVTISYPRRFALHKYSVYSLGSATTTWGPIRTFSLSECMTDEDDATQPKFFECIEDITREDMKTWVTENRQVDQEFHELLGLWKADAPDRIKLSVSFSMCELKGGREAQILVPLKGLLDPEFVAATDRNWGRLNIAWLEPVGTWRGSYWKEEWWQD